jgi:hypothetical protein
VCVCVCVYSTPRSVSAGISNSSLTCMAVCHNLRHQVTSSSSAVLLNNYVPALALRFDDRQDSILDCELWIAHHSITRSRVSSHLTVSFSSSSNTCYCSFPNIHRLFLTLSITSLSSTRTFALYPVSTGCSSTWAFVRLSFSLLASCFSRSALASSDTKGH